MRLRVVCGLDVTMAIFCPTRRFTSVDFPAFGRPTTATNPDLNAFFSGISLPSIRSHQLCFKDLAFCRSGLHLLANAYPQHFCLIRFQHFESMPFEVRPIAGRGHLAGNRSEEHTSEL